MSTLHPDGRTQSIGMKSANYAKGFQFDDADIIIRAKGVDFQAHKVILSLVSPIFKDMFSLPETEASQGGLHVVDITEDPQTIRNILRFCYPNMDDPFLFDLHEIHRALLALRKYDMDRIRTLLAGQLEARAFIDPVRVFAIACNAGLQDVARSAAQRSLSLPSDNLIPDATVEYRVISAASLIKLQRYHRQCRQAAKTRFKEITHTSTGLRAGVSCEADSALCPFGPPITITIPGSSRKTGKKYMRSTNAKPRQWWSDYIEALEEKLTIQPLGINFACPQLLERCHLKASKCPQCAPVCVMDLTKLGKRLKEHISDAVSKVQLTLDDDDFTT